MPTMSVALTCPLFFEFLLFPISPEKKNCAQFSSSIRSCVLSKSLENPNNNDLSFAVKYIFNNFSKRRGGELQSLVPVLFLQHDILQYAQFWVKFWCKTAGPKCFLRVGGRRGNIYCWLNVMCQTPCDVLLTSSFHSFFHGKNVS